MNEFLFKTVSIIGLGYIGLPTAALLARQKINVIGVDIDNEVVSIINSGKIHLSEPGLEVLVYEGVRGGYLRGVTTPQLADIFLIAVPTPITEDHKPDLDYVYSAVKSIGPVLQKGNLIILESTSPVGTTENVSRLLSDLRPDLKFPHQFVDNPDINIAYCPERVMPGKILVELIENNRIIGGVTPQCAVKAKALYSLFVKNNCLVTSVKIAEMIKLTENAFRDVNIAFANELSMICDQLKIDVWELIKLANFHPRVKILNPGPGVGGHCIAVDPWFIVNAAPEYSKLIRTAREVNNIKPHFIVEKINKIIESIPHPIIACFGLTYKADTDDLRESPVIEIMRQLAQSQNSLELLIVEPNINELPYELEKMNRFTLVSAEVALKVANAIVLMVDHKEFKVLREQFMTKLFINIIGPNNSIMCGHHHTIHDEVVYV